MFYEFVALYNVFSFDGVVVVVGGGVVQETRLCLRLCLRLWFIGGGGGGGINRYWIAGYNISPSLICYML